MVARGVERILKDKRGLLLQFDHGLEEGPKGFNLHSIDPSYVLNIALEGGYTGMILHAGMAEKYVSENLRDVPLIIKLNGRSALAGVNPAGKQFTSVERAIKLGAQGVAFTLADDSSTEADSFNEFGHVVEQAHDYGIPVLALMQPKTTHLDTDSIAYLSRIALELGADAVQLRSNGDKHGFSWAAKAAGRTNVFATDPQADTDIQTLQAAHDAILGGATGLTMGRTVWQHPKPFSLTRALHAIIFKDKTPQEALKYLS